MARLIKKAINDKNLFYQCFVKNKDFTNNDSDLEKLLSLQNNSTNTTGTTKQEYFAKTAKSLSSPNTSSKTYKPILKYFSKAKKGPCIPRVFHKSKFITDFLLIKVN